jgi:alpha-amylase
MISQLLFGVVLSNPYRPEVLGPMVPVTDWPKFSIELQRIKATGVQAFATDIWWGRVEKADEKYDWTYYDQLSSHIIRAGLKWIPILSTHQGGGYGGECNEPVPAWSGLQSNQDLQFVDVFGRGNTEYFSPWSGDYAYQQYEQLYAAFARRYAHLKGRIVRIDLSGGPSGELRYPSYSLGWQYPHRGLIQAYSKGAVESWRNFVMDKYKTFDAVSNAWGVTIGSREDIFPPCDVTNSPVTKGVCAGRTGSDKFFSHGYKTPYGKDFGAWYQGTLLKHSAKLAKAAHKHFDVIFGVPIAMKVAGIHWQHFNPDEPMSAERAAGYWDYKSLLQSFKHQKLEVTFTAIEMDDNPVQPTYSGAKTLTTKFFKLCNDLQAPCGSENALSVHNVRGYHNMRAVLSQNPILSLTLLRYDDLVYNIANTQAYANYVVAVRDDVQSLFFKVKLHIAAERVFVVGHIRELAKGFSLTKFQCSPTECEWIGNLVYARPNVAQGINFKIATVTQGKTSMQCDHYAIVQTTRSANALVNYGIFSANIVDNILTAYYHGLKFCPVTKK